MKTKQLLQILEVAGKLKTTTRHCYTEIDRKESVADHSWRVALMAMLMEEEYPDLDINKVIRMCLIHDLGEAFTGDIPTFIKTNHDTVIEDDLFTSWINTFDEAEKTKWNALLNEMNEQKSKEAKLYKTLDKMEALISHNESDLSTWLDLEYDLQYRYGKKEAEFSEYTNELRKEIDIQTTSAIKKYCNELQIYTSYFDALHSLPEEIETIAICLEPPVHYEGKWIVDLAPSKDLLHQYHASFDQEFYKERYYKDVLQKLDIDEIYETIRQLSNGKDCVLLCYEKPDEFCHRHLVADYLNQKLGLHIIEYPL